MEDNIRASVARYQFRKSMSGSGFVPSRRLESSLFVWLGVLAVFVLWTLDEPKRSLGILSAIGLLSVGGIIYLAVGLRRLIRRDRHLRTWTNEETQREIFAKIDRQVAELASLWPNMSQGERNLLSFLAMTINKEGGGRDLRWFLEMALRTPTLSQTDFVREISADLRVR